MKKKQRIIFIALALLSLMTSCQREDFKAGSSRGVISPRVTSSSLQTKGGAVDTEEQSGIVVLDTLSGLSMIEYVGDNLSSPFTGSDIATKGTVITTGNISSVYGEFGMEAFLDNYDEIDCDDAVKPVLTGADQYISGGKAIYDEGDWTLVDGSGNEYPWLNEIKFTFWSYAPLTSKGLLSFGSAGSRQVMTITDYVNPTKAADQKDLLVAYNNRTYGKSDYSETIDIAFRHALSVVYFDASGVTDVTVKKISIIDAFSKGSCAVTGADLSDSDVTKAFSWTPGSAKETFEMTGTEDKFFMIPQALPEGAAIGLTLEKDGVQTYVEKPMSTTWLAGKYYKYVLTYTDGDISVSVVETFPSGATSKKNVSAKNTSNSKAAYIRMAITSNWVNEDGLIVSSSDFSSEGSIEGFMGDNWVKSGDYYYYKYAVRPGQKPMKDLFTSYTPAKAPSEGLTYRMTIMAQGVEYDGSKTYVKSAWGDEVPLENSIEQ